jgi:hypothetical protein
MEVTYFTFIIIPFTLLWIGNPGRLLELTAASCVFEAAAAFIIGGFGMQPSLLPAFGFMAYVALQVILGARYPGQGDVWRICWPFTLVAFYALAGSYFLPRLFEDQAWVWPQKSLPPFVLTPLAPSSASINQDCYLIANACLLLCASAYLTRTGLKLRRILDAWFISGFLAAAVAIWQFANRVAGLPFPTDLFYSNPGWAVLTAQGIGAIPRINGPFSEPAALGGFMAACACAAGWMLLNGSRERLVKSMLVVSLATASLSTSTTGFVTLAAAATLAAGYAVVNRSRKIINGLMQAAIPTVAAALVLGLASAAFAPEIIDDVTTVFDATLSKTDSSSYADRTNTDVDSLKVAVDTWGLGAGWGSNRSSSLVPGVLSAVGLPGLAGLLWYGCRLAGMVRRAKRRGCTPQQASVIDGCCGGLMGFLIAALVSGPTITSPVFFLLLALLTATTVRVVIDSSAQREASRSNVRMPIGASAASAEVWQE